jgi:hypothetical protein
MKGVMLETDVDSFIVRFVQVRDSRAGSSSASGSQQTSQDNDPVAVPWHGFIRHVQSKEEIRFTHIEEALRFVANYVELSTGEPEPADDD